MTVVVGYVPTAVGRAALRRAAAEAELRGWKLVTVHSETLDEQFDQDEDEALEAELAVIREHLLAVGIEHEEVRFEGVRSVRGTAPSLPERGVDPGEDLISVAEEVGARLVVVGIRRRSLVGKLFLGSNAQKVLQGAPCAVLGVHLDDVTE